MLIVDSLDDEQEYKGEKEILMMCPRSEITAVYIPFTHGIVFSWPLLTFCEYFPVLLKIFENLIFHGCIRYLDLSNISLK